MLLQLLDLFGAPPRRCAEKYFNRGHAPWLIVYPDVAYALYLQYSLKKRSVVMSVSIRCNKYTGIDCFVH